MVILEIILKSLFLALLLAGAGKLVFSRDSEWKLFLSKVFFVLIIILPLMITSLPEIKIPFQIKFQAPVETEPHSYKQFGNHEFLPDYYLSSDNKIVHSQYNKNGVTPENSDHLPGLETILLIWLAGFSAVSLWLITGHMVLFKSIGKDQPATGELKEIFENLREEILGHSNARLLLSNRILVPCTTGYFKPVVIFPEKLTGLPVESLRLSLRHELEHIRRKDFLWNLIVNISCAVLWFNPIVWFIAAQYRIFREKSVDERIVRQGVNPADYAHLLVNVADQTGNKPGFLTNALMISKVTSLKDRIISILYSDKDNKSCRKLSKIIAFCLILSVSVFISALKPEGYNEKVKVISRAYQAELEDFSKEEIEKINLHIGKMDYDFHRNSYSFLEELLDLYPMLPELRMALVESYLHGKKLNKAKEQAVNYIKLCSDKFWACIELASTFSVEKEFDVAFHWLYKAALLKPDEVREMSRWRMLSSLARQHRYSILKNLAGNKKRLQANNGKFLQKDLENLESQLERPDGSKAPTALLEVISIHDPDHNRRNIALELLGGIGSLEAYHAIENAMLREIDPDIIEEGFESLGRFPADILESNIKSTASKMQDPWAVVFSARILSRTSPELAATTLLNILLLKTDQECQKYALYFLSLIPEHGNTALKEVAKNHPSESIRSRADRYLHPKKNRHH